MQLLSGTVVMVSLAFAAGDLGLGLAEPTHGLGVGGS